LHEIAAFYTEQCTAPVLFHHFDIPYSTSNYALNNYGFVWNAIFFLCMHAWSPNNKTYLLLKIANS